MKICHWMLVLGLPLCARGAALNVTTNGAVVAPSNFPTLLLFNGSNTVWEPTNFTDGGKSAWGLRLHVPAATGGISSNTMDLQTNTVPANAVATSLNLIPGGNVAFATTNRGSTTDVEITASIVGGAASMADVTNVVESYVGNNATNAILAAVNAASNSLYTVSSNVSQALANNASNSLYTVSSNVSQALVNSGSNALYTVSSNVSQALANNASNSLYTVSSNVSQALANNASNALYTVSSNVSQALANNASNSLYTVSSNVSQALANNASNALYTVSSNVSQAKVLEASNALPVTLAINGGTGSTNIVIDFLQLAGLATNRVRVTLTANAGIVVTNIIDGKELALDVIQDAVGFRTIAVSAVGGAPLRFGSDITGFAWTTNGGYIDHVKLYGVGTNAHVVGMVRGYAP